MIQDVLHLQSLIYLLFSSSYRKFVNNGFRSLTSHSDSLRTCTCSIHSELNILPSTQITPLVKFYSSIRSKMTSLREAFTYPVNQFILIQISHISSVQQPQVTRRTVLSQRSVYLGAFILLVNVTVSIPHCVKY